MVPKDLLYTETHEWVHQAKDICTVGITQFAVEQLTDVVHLELKPAGTHLRPKSEFGEIESVKAVSSLYAPVAGTIEEINQEAIKDPSLVSSDPYGKGWLVKIRMLPEATMLEVINAAQYEKQIASGH